MSGITHQGIREAVRERIVAGEWKLGELIPGEAAFADYYGCSRTTVNRALRALADEGIVERKRKGGTRVRPLPTPLAQFHIPIIREQVENLGQAYSNRILLREERTPPAALRSQMKLDGAAPCAYMESLHLAEAKPFAFETRWVNLATVPDFAGAELNELSANEWLVRTVPFSRGDVKLSAAAADMRMATVLEIAEGAALFFMERMTWLDDRSVTTMTLYYTPGYAMDFEI